MAHEGGLLARWAITGGWLLTEPWRALSACREKAAPLLGLVATSLSGQVYPSALALEQLGGAGPSVRTHRLRDGPAPCGIGPRGE